MVLSFTGAQTCRPVGGTFDGALKQFWPDVHLDAANEYCGSVYVGRHGNSQSQ